MFQHAVYGTYSNGFSVGECGDAKAKSRVDLGYAGSTMEWRTNNGTIGKEILKYGLHDGIMGTAIIVLAIMRIFQSTTP